MNKEEFDKNWDTCKHCGITKEDIKKQESEGNFTCNFVSAGCCTKCREKIKNKEDFEEAKKEGSITRNDSIMCPYCGAIQDNDLYDEEEGEWICPECEQKCELAIETTFHYTTRKKEGF